MTQSTLYTPPVFPLFASPLSVSCENRPNSVHISRPEKFSLVLIAALALALALIPARAFAQRAGAASAGTQAGTAAAHVGGSVSPPPVALSHLVSPGRNASAHSSNTATPDVKRIQPPSDAKPDAALSTTAAPAPASSFVYVESTSNDISPRARSLPGTYPRQVTIGFPPRSFGELSLPSTSLLYPGTVVEGQRNELWASTPQRGAVAQHPSAPVHASAPVTAARPVAPSRMPAGGARIAPPVQRLGYPRAPRPPLWFLAHQPASTLPHVFGPVPRGPRFGGFGFFGTGFGFPFVGFGFFPNCNPFWAYPWAFGCSAFGYWDGGYWPGYAGYAGYTGGFYTGYNATIAPSEEPQEEEEMQQPAQEPQTYTYIPPPEPSSPEEIQAEKSLVVLYMKNGAVYAVTNYWVADNKLHYLTSYGAENTIDMDELDLQKTVDVNSARGVQFTLKPAPDQKPPQPPQDQPKPPDPQN